MADVVADDEILYRSIRQDQYQVEASGMRIHSTAFGDRNQQVSFDRAKLCSIQQAQKMPDQAVFSVTAGEVRKIQGVVINEITYRVEVTASPLEDNSAHAHVEALPPNASVPILSQTGFKKLQRELAKIARIEMLPVNF